jgi:DNA-binding beta-propeller fold protein YncE
VALSISGLPAGTSASFNPATILPGQSGTVTITATSTAAPAQNAEIQVTGTPLAPVSTSSITFLVDVAPKPGSLPNNRTDYLSTEATPYGAVYDPVHKLIFSSNNSWNRVDVISVATHALVKAIAIPDPHGIDMAIDNSRVWVATGSQRVRNRSS